MTLKLKSLHKFQVPLFLKQSMNSQLIVLPGTVQKEQGRISSVPVCKQHSSLESFLKKLNAFHQFNFLSCTLQYLTKVINKRILEIHPLCKLLFFTFTTWFQYKNYYWGPIHVLHMQSMTVTKLRSHIVNINLGAEAFHSSWVQIFLFANIVVYIINGRSLPW